MLEPVLAAVVLIRSGTALCAGVHVEGRVVTAAHCVADRGRAVVEDQAGHRRTASVVARDPGRDLALLTLEGDPDLEPRLELRVDPALVERVYAVGHPFGHAAGGALAGTLRWSVSEGIVSAVGDTFVQTDTAVNPGNSGGPLVDAEGRVVGIVSRKLRADNVAFATRATHVRALLDEPRQPLLGGSFGLDLALVGGLSTGGGTWVGATPWLLLRPGLVARGWVGAGPQPELLGAVTVGGRLAVGHGPWAGGVEAGGGLAGAGELTWVAQVHANAGPLGLGGWWMGSEGPMLVLTLGFPGRLGVY